ncbi:MAG TPA: metal-binding protein [Blastocatellia bacterium]|nr:metal-binding protein [Blastocatellia bacterium]
MPSGRTHDLITLAISPAVFAGAQMYTDDVKLAIIATVATLFSGFMFGPDLDLDSKPYRRWGPLRFIWYPYKAALSHRSSLSHGLIFSTIFRILYFVAVVAVLATAILYLRQRYLYGQQTTWNAEFQRVSLDIGAMWMQMDKPSFWAAFAGLWIGAAAHTISDVFSTASKKLW